MNYHVDPKWISSLFSEDDDVNAYTMPPGEKAGHGKSGYPPADERGATESSFSSIEELLQLASQAANENPFPRYERLRVPLRDVEPSHAAEREEPRPRGSTRPPPPRRSSRALPTRDSGSRGSSAASRSPSIGETRRTKKKRLPDLLAQARLYSLNAAAKAKCRLKFQKEQELERERRETVSRRSPARRSVIAGERLYAHAKDKNERRRAEEAQQEQLQREAEPKRCFTPHITALSRELMDRGGYLPPERRLSLERARADEQQMLHLGKEAEELKRCTFTPQLSSGSRRITQWLQHSSSPCQRLYEDGMSRQLRQQIRVHELQNVRGHRQPVQRCRPRRALRQTSSAPIPSRGYQTSDWRSQSSAPRATVEFSERQYSPMAYNDLSLTQNTSRLRRHGSRCSIVPPSRSPSRTSRNPPGAKEQQRQRFGAIFHKFTAYSMARRQLKGKRRGDRSSVDFNEPSWTTLADIKEIVETIFPEDEVLVTALAQRVLHVNHRLTREEFVDHLLSFLYPDNPQPSDQLPHSSKQEGPIRRNAKAPATLRPASASVSSQQAPRAPCKTSSGPFPTPPVSTGSSYATRAKQQQAERERRRRAASSGGSRKLQAAPNRTRIPEEKRKHLEATLQRVSMELFGAASSPTTAVDATEAESLVISSLSSGSVPRSARPTETVSTVSPASSVSSGALPALPSASTSVAQAAAQLEEVLRPTPEATTAAASHNNAGKTPPLESPEEVVGRNSRPPEVSSSRPNRDEFQFLSEVDAMLSAADMSHIDQLFTSMLELKCHDPALPHPVRV